MTANPVPKRNACRPAALAQLAQVGSFQEIPRLCRCTWAMTFLAGRPLGWALTFADRRCLLHGVQAVTP